MQPKTNPRLAGPVVLVTGAAKAIGRAICLRLAAEGAHIGCADLDAHGTASTARDRFYGDRPSLAISPTPDRRATLSSELSVPVAPSTD